MGCVSGLAPAFAWLAPDLGCVSEAEKALERSTATRWAEVARLILDGEAAAAAEELDEISHRSAAACARSGVFARRDPSSQSRPDSAQSQYSPDWPAPRAGF
jgi:hypothetical protein